MPAARTDTIAFPALAISPGDSFGVVTAVPTNGTVLALRKGYFERLYFFDSSGRSHRVARIAARPGLVDRLLNRRVSVSLELEAADLSLSSVVRDLCALIDADPDDLYSQYVSHDELKTKFTDATSPEQLIQVASTLGGPA